MKALPCNIVHAMETHMHTILSFGHRIGVLEREIDTLRMYIHEHTRYESMSEEMHELDSKCHELVNAKLSLSTYIKERYHAKA